MKPPAVAIRSTRSDGEVPCPIPGEEVGAEDGDEVGAVGGGALGEGDGDRAVVGAGDGGAVVVGDAAGEPDGPVDGEGFGDGVGVAPEHATAAMATAARAIVRAALDTRSDS